MGTRRAPTSNLANSIGIDVMRVHIPPNETFPTFLESLALTVRLFATTGVPIHSLTYPADTRGTNLPLELTTRPRCRSYCPLRIVDDQRILHQSPGQWHGLRLLPH
jgi:hypothetical protein